MHRTINYEVIEHLATIAEGTQVVKRLSLVKWEDNPARLEVRQWIRCEDGEKPGKGVTMSEDEAKRLLIGLGRYLQTREREREREGEPAQNPEDIDEYLKG